MAPKRQTLTVFLDSSVLFAAVSSPTGGSSKLFTLKNLQLTTSRVVLTEVERNVRKKLESYHLDRFFLLVDKLTIIAQTPDESLIFAAKKATAEKDIVILAEAKQAKMEILVTLDQRHLLTPVARKFFQPGKILTPKDIIQSSP